MIDSGVYEMMGDLNLPHRTAEPSRQSPVEYFPKMPTTGPYRNFISPVIKRPSGFEAWKSEQQSYRVRTPPGFEAWKSQQQGYRVRIPSRFEVETSQFQDQSSKVSAEQKNKGKRREIHNTKPVKLKGPNISLNPEIQDDSESDVSAVPHDINYSRNTSEKIRQRVRKITQIIPFLSSSKPTHKKHLISKYCRIENSTPNIYCFEWSRSSTNPIFPPVKILRKTTENTPNKKVSGVSLWRSLILFSWEGRLHSYTIVCHDVCIPYSYEKRYGSSFLYVGLPKDLESKLRMAGVEYPSLSTRDKEINNTKLFWWKIIRNVDGLMGIVNEMGTFEPKSLEKIFEKTRRGIKASLILRFHCEATTKGKKSLHSRDITTIGVELVRGNIERIGEMIRLPPGLRNVSRMVGFESDEIVSNQLRVLGE